MVLHNNAIICGGNEYAPKLEKVGNTERLTFCVLMTRGGNQKKNFDIFQVKAFGTMAKKYFEELKDDKMKGKTVGLQLSLENNSNGFLYEFICTYMNTALGESIVIKDLPECAKEVSGFKVVETPKPEVKVEEKTSVKEERPTNVVSKPQTPTKTTTITSNITEDDDVRMVAESMEDISNIVLLEAPIGLMSNAKNIFKNAKLVSMQGKVVGALADNPDYLIFRQMMG